MGPVCERCGFRVKEFPTTRTSYKLKDGTVVHKEYRLHFCHGCLRDQKRAAAHRRGEKRAPRTQEQRRRENARESSKAARRRYRQTPKGKAADRRTKKKARWKKRARLTAALPTPVLKPFVDRAIDQAGGQRQLEIKSGVPARRLWAITHEAQRSISMRVVDKLARVCDFTLEEITERAVEWALLTGDPWPIGYKRELSESETWRDDPLPRRKLRNKLGGLPKPD